MFGLKVLMIRLINTINTIGTIKISYCLYHAYTRNINTITLNICKQKRIVSHTYKVSVYNDHITPVHQCINEMEIKNTSKLKRVLYQI